MKVRILIPVLTIAVLLGVWFLAPEPKNTAAHGSGSADLVSPAPTAPGNSADPASPAPTAAAGSFWSSIFGGETPAGTNSAPDTSDPGAAATLSPTPGPEVIPSSPPASAPPPSNALPWYLTLVNAAHPLPDNFSVTTSTLPNGLAFDSRAFGALNDMLSAGRAQGLSFVVCSAYRSSAYQRQLFDNQVERYVNQGYSRAEAEALTAKAIMPPGTSEHNLGLAADIVSMDYQLLDENQANTAEQKWLMEHCWEYGFILRYPADKQSITGIIYEPWHYRYVGVEAALAMRESGQCLEEYLGS